MSLTVLLGVLDNFGPNNPLNQAAIAIALASNGYNPVVVIVDSKVGLRILFYDN